MKVGFALIAAFFVVCLGPSVSAQPRRTEGRMPPPKPFIVTIDTHISGNAFPVVQGITNLPNGTVLWVTLLPPYPECFLTVRYCLGATPEGDKEPLFSGGRVTVNAGKFSVGPGWTKAWPRSDGEPGFRSGRYILEVHLFEMAGRDHQPPNVRAVIGARGEYMRGPLVGACCFGFGLPGRAGNLADAQQYMNNTRPIEEYFGPNVYYARYVSIK